MAEKKKGKALTRAEKDKLRELDRENARVSQEAEAKKRGIQEQAESQRREARRKSASVIKTYHDDFAKQKKDLDKWKAAEERRVQKEYAGRFAKLRDDRQDRYDGEERIMGATMAEIEAWECEELRRVETKINKKIREIVTARGVITGPGSGKGGDKKVRREKDDTPVEVPVERSDEQAAPDDSAGGEGAGGGAEAGQEGDRPEQERAG